MCQLFVLQTQHVILSLMHLMPEAVCDVPELLICRTPKHVLRHLTRQQCLSDFVLSYVVNLLMDTARLKAKQQKERVASSADW